MGMMIILRKKIINFMYLFKIYTSKGNESDESGEWSAMEGARNTNACLSGNNI